MVEPSERGVEGGQVILGQRSLPHNITKVKECGECFRDIGWHDSFEGGQIDLHYVSTVTYVRKCRSFTFIKALELLPVHCWKQRPCLNRRRPGNGGASEILLHGEL